MLDLDDEVLNRVIRDAMQRVNAFYAELHGESHRATAVLALARIEAELLRAILTKFPGAETNKKAQELFKAGGPMQNLKHKADFALAFDLIDKPFRSNLETLSTIRNKFAHHDSVRCFTQPVVADWCAKLAFVPRGVTEPRERFLAAAKEASARLEAVAYSAPRAPQPRGLLSPEP